MVNKMSSVAALLGVELGESFKIADDRSNFWKWERCYRFTNNGMEMSKDEIHWEKCTSELLEWLIKGEIDIKLPWKPEYNEKYYIPSISNASGYNDFYWKGDNSDDRYYNRGLVFKSKEEAIALGQKMLAVAKEEVCR